jgi:ketosteroid isomerase-like protein
MSAEDEIRQASKQFYAGLSRMANGDAGPLADIWSHSAAVTAMHPIGGRDVGWDAVRGSFEQVAQLCSEGKIELKDQLIQVAGDPVSIEQRVTNIYQRVAEVWKIVHHHADISPTMLDVLSRLQPPSAKAGG